MALYTSTSSATASEKPIGTLQTEGLFHQPPLPNRSQAAGIQGTDGRSYTRNVGQSEVATNHLNDMLSGNSKYIQNARQRGIESAARRGLMNSSIAAGNAERAAIESASPFAMQAADAYGRAQTENLGYLNQNLMQERDIANEVLKERMAAEAQAGAGRDIAAAMEQEAQNRYRMFTENLAFEGEQRGLDRAHDFGISDMGYRQDLGRMGSEFGYDIGRQGFQNQWQSRENDRDFYRTIARDNNQFSNQYGYDTAAAIRDQRIRRSDAAFTFGLESLMNDPSTSLSDVDGAMSWLGDISNREIDVMLESLWGGF
jgi:hypothetical protein